MKNKLCISIGDINGIGIEMLLNIYDKSQNNDFILFTNLNIFERYLIKNNIKIKINVVNKNNNLKFDKDKINIYDFKASNYAENTFKSIKQSYYFCLNNSNMGLITLPLNKKLISNKFKSFIGHTEYLEKLSKSKTSNMIFILNKLIISTLTTHLPINKIRRKISNKNFIFEKVITLNNTLKKDFKIKKPKILISGMNPHAGENGYIGNEEIKYIIPQIIKLKKHKVNIHGPISGDSMLTKYNLKKYDCFLFVFHDQGLIPFKYISNFQGVHYTSNLKILRVSPDHGTAYDLVGKNVASNKSLLNCFKFIKKINKNRNSWKIQKNI